MITTYFVTRDTARKTASDENRAMAHALIGKFDNFDVAKKALVDYMEDEVEWLLSKKYRSTSSLRRAVDIIDGIETVKTWTNEMSGSWSQASTETCGLIWAIARVQKGA